jgi:hypothetical protein
VLPRVGTAAGGVGGFDKRPAEVIGPVLAQGAAAVALAGLVDARCEAGSRAPSSAPSCTPARPAEPDDKAPDKRTTRPRQPPESGNAEAIDVRADTASQQQPSY